MTCAEGVNAEVRALLQLHLPAALNELENYILETCRYFDVKIPGLSATDMIIRQVPVYLQGQHNASHTTVKCDGVLLGAEISEAKISIQLPRSGKSTNQLATYHTTISHDNPWRLEQLQDAGNYIASALAILRSRDRCPNISGMTSKTTGVAITSSSVSPPLFASLADASAFLNKILQLLMRGLNTLCTPPNLRLTSTGLVSLKSKPLNPPLPDDLCLSVHVQTEKLVLTLYQVPSAVVAQALTSQQRKSSATMQALPQAVPIVPSIRLHVDASVGHLERLVAEYRRAVAACHSLVDKVSILSQFTDGVAEVTPSEIIAI